MNPTPNRRVFLARPTIGLALGWLASWARPGSARAAGASRSGESAAASGPFDIQLTFEKMQVPIDTAYWIDYRSARLYAAVPKVVKSATVNDIISDLPTRDLVEDFGLAAGVVPHFLMNTGSLGAAGAGRSALYVVETTTKQVAIYWTYFKSASPTARPEFERIQILSYAPAPGTPAPGSVLDSTSTTGPVMIQRSGDKTMQVPLDAVYWAETYASGARLYAAIPEVRRTAEGTTILGAVGGRDLYADFKIKPETEPRFLLNCASLGPLLMGQSALFVVETTTKQVGIYQSYTRATAAGARPEVQLVQLKAYDDRPLPPLPAGN